MFQRLLEMQMRSEGCTRWQEDTSPTLHHYHRSSASIAVHSWIGIAALLNTALCNHFPALTGGLQADVLTHSMKQQAIKPSKWSTIHMCRSHDRSPLTGSSAGTAPRHVGQGSATNEAPLLNHPPAPIVTLGWALNRV